MADAPAAEALRAFLAPDATLDGLVPALPLSLPVEALSGPRVADVALLLGLIAAFWGVGALLRRAGLAGLRPAVFAAGLTGALLLFGTNTDFYEVASLELTETSLTVRRHVGADATVALAEVRTLTVDSGRLFPLFSDDRVLVLTTTAGPSVAIPRFLPRVEEAVRALASRLPPTATAPTELESP
jgi:hypothetical protein